MSERVFNNALTGNIFVEGPSAHQVWNTQRLPVHLLPESAWITLSGFAIAFPDFAKGGGYGYLRYINPFGFDSDGCITGLSLLPQYWDSGPTTIGTIPAGCNYIDVRGSLTRTKAPSDVLGTPVSNNLPNAETVLTGGWCLVESEFSWSRTFEIYRSGTDVLLRRKQSVRAAQSGENPSWTSNFNNNGWSHFGGSGAENGALVAKIDEKSGSLGGGGSRRRDGANACSMDTSGFDFSSTYTGTIIVRPGFIAP